MQHQWLQPLRLLHLRSGFGVVGVRSGNHKTPLHALCRGSASAEAIAVAPIATAMAAAAAAVAFHAPEAAAAGAAARARPTATREIRDEAMVMLEARGIGWGVTEDF